MDYIIYGAGLYWVYIGNDTQARMLRHPGWFEITEYAKWEEWKKLLGDKYNEVKHIL